MSLPLYLFAFEIKFTFNFFLISSELLPILFLICICRVKDFSDVCIFTGIVFFLNLFISGSVKNILLNSVKGSQNIKKGTNNIIQLPSVSSSNIIFTPTKQNESLSKESNNIKSIVTDNNVIVLPEIKNLKTSVDNINKDDTAVENKRYLLLFQKNNNKEFTAKKTIKFNNNVIILNEEKEKTKNKGNAKSLNEPKKTKKDNIFNKRTKI